MIPSVRKKAKTLTNEDRLRAAKLVVDHQLPIARVANQFDVSWNVVQRASKKKRYLQEGLEQGFIKPKRKRQKGSKFPHIEERLFEWVRQMRVLKIPLTKQVIISREKEIDQSLCIEETKKNEEKINEFALTTNFGASNDWFNRFKQRYELHSK